MAEKHILIAIADPAVQAEYGRALAKEGKVILVSSSAAALSSLTARSRDIIVADYDLPDGNGVQLLDRVKTDFPKVIRILIVPEIDRERRTAEVQGSHLILTKPCDEATLRGAVERALAINVWLTNDGLRELVGRLRTFPIIPSLYLEVVSALKTQHTTTAEVGAIIAKDMAMMTKLLQVTNSACFGLQRKINDPVEAVGILGFETVKSMVMTLKLLSQYDKVKPVYFSIDRLWRHSTEVGRSARRIALAHTNDAILGETAFTAGLMHDLGKLILASNFDEQYSGAQNLARKQQIEMEEVEKDIFGATHGVLGAYLLGLWGMPLDLVECAAFHHCPSRSQAKRFTALTAVHIANVFIHEAKPDKDGFVVPKLDENYLAELGITAQLDSWRQFALDADSGETVSRTRSGVTTTFKKPAAPVRKLALQPEKPIAVPVPAPARFRWIYAGAGAAAFATCAWFVADKIVGRMMEPVIAPPGQVTQSPPVVPPPAKAAPVVLPDKPVVKTPEDLASTSAAVESNTPSPVAAVTPPAAPATPPPSAKELAFGKLQLESIYFSKSNPSAVINGTWVHARDRLPAGATVVEIGPSTVTLEFESERKILALK